MLKDKVILSISPFIAKPFIHGSITRIYYLNRELAYKNRLLLATRAGAQAEPVDFPVRTRLTNPARYAQLFSPGFVRDALGQLKQEKVDFILANHLWSGWHGLILSRLGNIPLIFDNHNVEYIRFKRSGKRFWPLIWLLEKVVCAGARKILCVSEVDRRLLAQGVGASLDKIQVVENGVDVAGLTRRVKAAGAGRIDLNLKPGQVMFLFYGSFTYGPNRQAAQIILDEILPCLSSLGGRGGMLFIGQGQPLISSPVQIGQFAVEWLGFVDDLIAYLKRCNVMIAPLLAGSGTRFKILESIACRRPVVTTTIGAEGLDRWACRPFLQICDEWEAFAKMALQLAYSEPAALSAEFMAKYDWPRIVERIEL